jgi:hypothetical protein
MDDDMTFLALDSHPMAVRIRLAITEKQLIYFGFCFIQGKIFKGCPHIFAPKVVNNLKLLASLIFICQAASTAGMI